MTETKIACDLFLIVLLNRQNQQKISSGSLIYIALATSHP